MLPWGCDTLSLPCNVGSHQAFLRSPLRVGIPLGARHAMVWPASYLRLTGIGRGGHLGFLAPARTIAWVGQMLRHLSQPEHLRWSMTWTNLALPMIALSSQALRHLVQPVHLETRTW